MRSQAAIRVALALVALLAAIATASAAPPRFIRNRGNHGPISVSRVAGPGGAARLRVRMYEPATRKGIEGALVHEVELTAGGQADPTEIAAAGRSLEQAIAVIQKDAWRQVGARHLFRGALKSLRAAKRKGAALDEVTAIERATDGLVGSLRVDEVGPTFDMWTHFIDPLTDAEDQRPGDPLGLDTTMGFQPLVLARVGEGGAAARAGLRKGDRLTSIDGIRLTGENYWATLQSRGELPFRLRYVRDGKRRTAVLRREPAPARPLAVERTPEGVAVVRFELFSFGIARQIKKALVALERDGPLRGLVLDLRGNRGGGVPEGMGLLRQLVARGSLGIYNYGDGTRKVERASGRARFAGRPIVVLVDGATFSMGEHIPHVLRERAEATGAPFAIVGGATPGKSFVQWTTSLERGALKLSMGEATDGKGRSIHGTGVVPDIDEAEAVRRQIAAHPGVTIEEAVRLEGIAMVDRMARERERR